MMGRVRGAPADPPLPSLGGLVLCGGRARRMGCDKATLVVDGERLVDRAVRRLAGIADPVILACGSRALRVPGCVSVEDAAEGAGPLGGIVAGLGASPRPLTAVVAVDMPWFDTVLLAGLARAWAGEDALVPVSPQGDEPLHAVYARSALPHLETALRTGGLKMRDVLGDLRLRRIDPLEWTGATEAARFATNLNTRTDLLSFREARPGAA